MIRNLILVVVFLAVSSYAEDLVNYSYKQSRIKSKAKNLNNTSSSKRKTCYIYVDISGNKEWRKYKHRLNTTIRKNQDNCKKYIIYKAVKNVHTNFYRTRATNSSSKEYQINLGAIVKENPKIDIEIYTVVKNSNLNNGFKEQKVNTGIVNDSLKINNTTYKSHSKIENSKIGQLNFLSEAGLNKAKEFLKKDEDDPFQ